MMEGLWGEVYGTLRSEFADVPDVKELTRILLRLTLAVLLGGLIGYERESAGKPAGLRTHMLVAMGSALFVLVPLQAGMPLGDMSRVLQGLMSGIGFLGAGAIIKHSGGKEDIRGLTIAASIWTVAAIGVACGLGREMTAVIATVFGLAILQLLYRLKQ
jgi:putative Mg2+ transporter-C (MgtC) family protein